MTEFACDSLKWAPVAKAALFVKAVTLTPRTITALERKYICKSSSTDIKRKMYLNELTMVSVITFVSHPLDEESVRNSSC